MFGLLFYLFIAIGVGAWTPSLKFGDARSFGVTIIGGYAVTLLALFLLHVVIRLPLNLTVWILSIVSLAGWVRAVPWLRDRRSLNNPGTVLPLLTLLAVAANGGIGYTPFTVDEFTNWIGVSRQIYLYDGYHAIRETVALPGYLPGWRLMLLLPWVAFGEMDLGQSATAPLVFHIGLAALIFELFRFEALRRGNFEQGPSSMIAWIGVLLYLAAEGTGKLWTYDLLIEQPQIYALAASLLYLYLLDDPDIPVERVLIHIGLAVVAGYLLKSAMITFLPGLFAVLVVLMLRQKEQRWPRRLAVLASRGAVVFLPVVSIALLWKGGAQANVQSCMDNPMATFSPDTIAVVSELDWRGLMARFATSVGHYVASYKTVVLAAAVLGVAAAVLSGRWVWLLAFSAFATIYMTALYWYHLTCFGPYYFETLNSIPRFSRVALQPFHAIGLVALVIFGLRCLTRGFLGELLKNRLTMVAMVAACAMLVSWQAVQLYRTAEDVTVRRYQAIDFRISEVRAAAAVVRDNVPTSPNLPLVQFVSQGTDADLLGYAKMYALDGERGHPRVLFRAAGRVSWSPSETRTNEWQSTATDEALLAEFQKADVIWPVVVDDFTAKALTALVSPGECDGNLVDRFLIKNLDGTFSCRGKPPR